MGSVTTKYRVVRLIGEGGMGAVYEAEHVDLGKRVALKTLLAGLGSNREAQVRFPTEGRPRHGSSIRTSSTKPTSGRESRARELLRFRSSRSAFVGSSHAQALAPQKNCSDVVELNGIEPSAS